MALPASDDEILLLHNPRCSKSRRAKELLEAAGRPFTERRYLDEPLALAELREVQARLGSSPRDWLRAREDAYAASGLSEGASDEQILAAMARHPILMERPIVVRGARAVVARPPEKVSELLG